MNWAWGVWTRLNIFQNFFKTTVIFSNQEDSNIRKVLFGISNSKEGSIVPGRDVVKPLFCSIHTPSRQGLLYLLKNRGKSSGRAEDRWITLPGPDWKQIHLKVFSNLTVYSGSPFAWTWNWKERQRVLESIIGIGFSLIEKSGQTPILHKIPVC